jgi:hypothetical protein
MSKSSGRSGRARGVDLSSGTERESSWAMISEVYAWCIFSLAAVLLLCLVIGMSGCGSVEASRSIADPPESSQLHSRPGVNSSPLPERPKREVWPEARVTLSGTMPFDALLSELAAQTGVTFVGWAGDTSGTMLVEWVDVPCEVAWRAAAAGLGAEALYTDGRVELRSRKGSNQAAVVAVGNLDPEEVSEALGVLGDVKLASIGDRVVVGGTDDQLQAAIELGRVVGQGVDGWRVLVRFVSVSGAVRRQAGLDVAVGGRIGATVGGSAGVGERAEAFRASPGAGVSGQFSAAVVLDAAERRRGARVLREATLFVLEGRSAKFSAGQVVPVPRRTVTDQGTVTVTGFDQVETGFIVDVAARRVATGVRLDVSPEVSTITGYVEGAPVRSRSAVTSTIVLQSGEASVMLGFDAFDQSNEKRGVPGFLGWSSDESSDERLVVVVEALRVYSQATAE